MEQERALDTDSVGGATNGEVFIDASGAARKHNALKGLACVPARFPQPLRSLARYRQVKTRARPSLAATALLRQ